MNWIGAGCATMLLTLPLPAAAFSTDPLIEGAKLCTRHLPRYERQYGVPVHLLSAISSTESGRWHTGLKIAVPWPWTINAEGKGYYFDSREQAIAAVRKLQAHGIKSIDVGCMQVNLVHHPEAFARLEDAFDPEINVAYAASFLRNLYQETGSWKQAAADYHSKTQARGEQYVGRVFSSWYKIIDKVRSARLQTQTASASQPKPALSPEQAGVMNVAKGETALPVSQSVASPVQLDEVSLALAEAKTAPRPMAAAELPPLPKAQRLTEQEGKSVQPHETPHMKVIQVSKKQRRGAESGVIVVRPEIDDAQVPGVQALVSGNTGFAVEPRVAATPHRDSTLTVADASHMQQPAPSAIPVEAAAAAESAPPVEPKVLSVSRTSTRKQGPNFIFQ